MGSSANMECRRRSKLCLLITLLAVSNVSATCYWRDGSDAVYGSVVIKPCSDGANSMCCAQSDGDTCLTNGLCQAVDGTLWRGACTNANWTSNACSQVCPDALDGEVQVQQCVDGSFCCSTDTLCCLNGEGVNNTITYNISSSYSSSSSGPVGSWNYIMNNAWLATPIIAFIGWANMWLVGALLACSKGADYGFIADRRYTGLCKRTCAPAFLATAGTANPSNVIGAVTMDPGFMSILDSLADCRAGFLDCASWVLQLAATVYAIFIACFVWAQDSKIRFAPIYIQYPLLLGVLNINRGTWSLAVLGSLAPGSGYTKLKCLMVTTFLAMIIDCIFISRALVMAWHINMVSTSKSTKILAWIFPGIEGFIFLSGLIAGYWRIKYIGPWVIPFIGVAMWLALGPIYVIAISILSHFRNSATFFFN